MVHVREIVEDGEIDGEDADLGTSKCENGHDPRDPGEGCPAEPK